MSKKIGCKTNEVRIENKCYSLGSDKSIDKILAIAKRDKKSAVIEISHGVFEDVYNLPKGHTYTLIDRDYLKEQDKYEIKDFVDEIKRNTPKKR